MNQKGSLVIDTLFNAFMEITPDEFDLYGTDMYVRGGLQNGFNVKADSFMQLPLDISLHHKKVPFEEEN